MKPNQSQDIELMKEQILCCIFYFSSISPLFCTSSLETVRFFIWLWVFFACLFFNCYRSMCRTVSKKGIILQLTFLEAWHKFVNNILHCSVMTIKEEKNRIRSFTQLSCFKTYMLSKSQC